MNAYVSVDAFKGSGVLDITGTSEDTRIRLLLEAVSRQVNRHCRRHFFVLEMARKFNGDGGLTLHVPDLISIDTSGLKTDDNKDRTFETTWPTTAYLLLPSNSNPTGKTDLSQPYRVIEVDVDRGTEDCWTKGIETVQVDGKWGWWEWTVAATETLGADITATATSITVSARTDIEAGHTILIGTEQIYVKSYSTNTLTVVRGVNGSTAATATSGAAISIYQYPDAVREAVIIEAARLWKRRSSGFASVIGLETGEFAVVTGGLSSESKMFLSSYRRMLV